MKSLPNLLCAITLLSMSGLVWASCQEGEEEDDRTSECKTSSKSKKSLSSGSGWGFAHTVAHDNPHELNAAFSIERFQTGRLIDEHGAAGVAH